MDYSIPPQANRKMTPVRSTTNQGHLQNVTDLLKYSRITVLVLKV